MLFFFFDSQLTGLIQNEQNMVISRHFIKHEYTHAMSGTIFRSEKY